MSGPESENEVKERKLPKQQLAILAICRFAEPLAGTSLYPYLPEMIRSFNVPDDQVGKWSGLCAAVFSFFQAIMGIPWGRASDRFGRKPAIILGLTITMITSLVWGFSTSLPMALAARAIAGAGNGNVGIIRTTVAEMVPYKELQPRAFSLMPLVWNVGSIFGPSIGGSLANPLNISPGHRPSSGTLLERFPYALPNIVSACFFLLGICTGTLFLQETLETKRNERDWGLVVGRKIVSVVKLYFRQTRRLFFKHSDAIEREPLIKAQADSEGFPSLASRAVTKTSPPLWSKVLTRQAILNLIAYAILAMHTMSYDQIIPVMMSERRRQNEISSNPLRFSGGFGLDHFQIGILSTCYGVFGMATQFFFFPPVARRFGVLYCLKWCAVVFPLTYLVTPFAILMPTQKGQVAVCLAIQLVKCVCAIFAFPCSTILLTNSASSLRTLGTLNGIATSVSAVGRAAGPAMVGLVYSQGYRQGYAIAPWWFLAAIGWIGAVPVWFLVEGEGFGDDADDGADDATDPLLVDVTDETRLEAEAVEGGAQATGGKPGPVLIPGTQDAHEVSEDAETTYGGVGPLSSTKLDSTSTTTDASNFETTPQRTRTLSRRSSQHESEDMMSRRHSVTPNNKVVARRYSSSLGQSLGSSGGFPEG